MLSFFPLRQFRLHFQRLVVLRQPFGINFAVLNPSNRLYISENEWDKQLSMMTNHPVLTKRAVIRTESYHSTPIAEITGVIVTERNLFSPVNIDVAPLAVFHGLNQVIIM